MPAASSCRPMCSVEDPGANSTNVSSLGPNGINNSHAAAPAVKDTTKKAASKTPAAPELFFLLLFLLRLTIQFEIGPSCSNRRSKPAQDSLLLRLYRACQAKMGHFFRVGAR